MRIVRELTIDAVLLKRGNDGDTEMQSLTKADHDARLDTLAKACAVQNKIGYHAAYTKVLETPEGKDLYAKSLSAPPGPTIAKQAPPLSKAQREATVLDTEFEEAVKGLYPDEAVSTATRKYLETPRGRAHYTEYNEEKRAVGAG